MDLASGLLLICLGAFLAISSAQLDSTLGIFIAVLMGSVAAFLYFNTYKARIWLGDVGSMSLGASLVVIGLLSGRIMALVVIGGVFVIEVGSSLIQLLSKKYFKRKVFPAAPFHLMLLKKRLGRAKDSYACLVIRFFLCNPWIIHSFGYII